jgi:hypothetical protein
MGYNMKGWSGWQNSPAKQKEDHKVGDVTQYKHPKYYNEDGSVKQGDTDEGELSEVKKDKDGRRYVEKSSDIGGGKLYLDPSK